MARMSVEQYVLQHMKTKKFFTFYIGNKPQWTGKPKEASTFKKGDAEKLKKRLLCQSQQVEAILL